ncbi:SAM-dependent methyltransferase [Microbispora sp. KK1-11]|uniref:SAM-dependent methyltransferase n=1 Tax=Microbispora sp. KK1-11 TaxID=2053005 RepID=UPI0028A6C746|nr:SAM-dependent methyltransferase [Microbispora sp. KK1-11]
MRRFLDLGAGLPTRGSVHEIALKEAPDSLVTYVDNDALPLRGGFLPVLGGVGRRP